MYIKNKVIDTFGAPGRCIVVFDNNGYFEEARHD